MLWRKSDNSLASHPVPVSAGMSNPARARRLASAIMARTPSRLMRLSRMHVSSRRPCTPSVTAIQRSSPQALGNGVHALLARGRLPPTAGFQVRVLIHSREVYGPPTTSGTLLLSSPHRHHTRSHFPAEARPAQRQWCPTWVRTRHPSLSAPPGSRPNPCHTCSMAPLGSRLCAWAPVTRRCVLPAWH